MQPDPAGYIDGLNLYTYAKNDGVNFSDPLGLYTSEPWGNHQWWAPSAQWSSGVAPASVGGNTVYGWENMPLFWDDAAFPGYNGTYGNNGPHPDFSNYPSNGGPGIINTGIPVHPVGLTTINAGGGNLVGMGLHNTADEWWNPELHDTNVHWRDSRGGEWWRDQFGTLHSPSGITILEPQGPFMNVYPYIYAPEQFMQYENGSWHVSDPNSPFHPYNWPPATDAH